MVILAFSSACTPTEKQPAKPSEVKPILDPPRNEDPKAKSGSEAALRNLFNLAKDGNCKAMAPMLVFRGDGAEKWKRSLNYAQASERVDVEKQCGILQVLHMNLDKMDFIQFIQEKESEGLWNIWEVKLQYEDASHETKFFAFLEENGTFLLGDID